MSFASKVVLVIGASSGIGASAAVHFAKEGADVVLVGRNVEKLNNVAKLCSDYGKTPLIVKADISEEDEAATAVEETIKKFGQLDVLVNNAGLARFGSILDGRLLQSYDDTLRTNLRGLMHLTELAAPHLIKTKGNIINISSAAGSMTPFHPVLIPYSISKAGLNLFTKGAAAELAPHGVRVNAISPGPVITDFIENYGMEGLNVSRFEEMKTPLNRVSESAEVAELILFLASKKAKGITGSNYLIDNGVSLTSS